MVLSIKENFSPTKSEVKRLSSLLCIYNSNLIGKYSSHEILVELVDDDIFIGGGYAIVKLGWVFIDLLWIEPQFRRKGFGSILLNKIESIAAKKYGIRFSKLNTGDFQEALEFYEHQGYRIFAELEIYPEHGLKNKTYIDFYMRKDLNYQDE